MYKNIVHKISDYVNLGIILKYSWDSEAQEIKRH